MTGQFGLIFRVVLTQELNYTDIYQQKERLASLAWLSVKSLKRTSTVLTSNKWQHVLSQLVESGFEESTLTSPGEPRPGTKMLPEERWGECFKSGRDMLWGRGWWGAERLICELLAPCCWLKAGMRNNGCVLLSLLLSKFKLFKNKFYSLAFSVHCICSCCQPYALYTQGCLAHNYFWK